MSDTHKWTTISKYSFLNYYSSHIQMKIHVFNIFNEGCINKGIIKKTFSYIHRSEKYPISVQFNAFQVKPIWLNNSVFSKKDTLNKHRQTHTKASCFVKYPSKYFLQNETRFNICRLEPLDIRTKAPIKIGRRNKRL